MSKRQKFEKIVLCSDPFATSPAEQLSNLRWFEGILKRPLSKATGLPVTSFRSQNFASGEFEQQDFSRAVFFEKCDVEFDLSAAQICPNPSCLVDSALAYTKACLSFDHALVIGYEFSEFTRTILNRLGVQFIDIWLHPVRFYDDVIFGFSASQPDVNERLNEFAISDDLLYLYADRVKVQTYKGWRRREADIADGSAVFVGQTLVDKAVAANGKMLNLLDFKDKFQDLSAQYSRVLYSRHPYVRTGDEAILRFIETCEFASVTDEPAYRLLASPRVQCVASISSSIIWEAKYFEKKYEYWYKPVINVSHSGEDDYYTPISQNIVCPNFWSFILSPIIKTQEADRVYFLDPKDKIRDMLGFYWGYREIDKLESLRFDFNKRSERSITDRLKRTEAQASKPAQKQSQKKSVPAGVEASSQFDVDVAFLKKQIASAGIVSFDIFETLIERPLPEPGLVSLLMGEDVGHQFRGKLSGFMEKRAQARADASKFCNGEEVPLRQRYIAMADRYKLDSSAAQELLSLELGWEKRLCRPRKLGRELYEYAKEQKKRIILVSDTYFDRDFLEELLALCSYDTYAELYASSEYETLKSTGNLFRAVLKKEKVSPSKIFHIGDNPHSDQAVPKKMGLRTANVGKSFDIGKASTRTVASFGSVGSARTKAALQGLIALEYQGVFTTDERRSFTHGSTRKLGYGVLGPMFFGFALWIYKKSIENGITDLYFLSRDGDIAKKCFDAAFQSEENAPKTHYVLASRRSIRTANIRTSEDIQKTLELPFSPCPLRSLLLNRFAIDCSTLNESILYDAGYNNFDEIADFKVDKIKLGYLFNNEQLQEKILENSALERESLCAYYQAHGLAEADDTRTAIVDIGHEGSLQAGLSQLLDKPNLNGLYFATFSQISSTIENSRSRSDGFLVDHLDRAKVNHSYSTYMLMYEFVFLNDKGSFLKVSKDGNHLVEHFDTIETNARRPQMIRESHAAAISFCADLHKFFGPLLTKFQLTGNESVGAFSAMLQSPAEIDAKLFYNMPIENKYSGRNCQLIINATRHNSDSTPGIWREGEKYILAARNDGRYGILGWRRLYTPLVIYFVRRIGGANQARVCRSDPAAFFDNLPQERYRKIGKMLYPKWGLLR